MEVLEQYQSKFFKNFLVLFKGSFLAQLIPLIISPVITRIYSPEQFGILALFVSLVTIIGSVINGRYEQAIMIVDDKKDIDALTFLSLTISFVASVLLTLFIAVFQTDIIHLFNSNSIANWLFFIPMVVFFIGAFNTFNFYYLKQERLKEISISEIERSLIFVNVQLLFPLFKSGVFGLIAGKIISTIYAPFYLYFKSDINWKNYDFNTMIIMAKRYINFPKYTSPAIFLNNIGSSGLQLLIPVFYSTFFLGLYSLMNKVMLAPFTFIGNSISQTYLKELSVSNGNSYLITKKIILKLFAISILGYGLSYFFIEDLFQFVYGEEWKLAGTFAKYLIPFFILKFVASPLTSIHTAFEKQKLSLILQFVLFVISIGVLLFCYYSNFSFEFFFKLFSVTMSVFYFFRVLIILHISKNK
jgi:O-antigen/teichoic acid export membrane protein